ncbi:MAG: hypothetical protein ACI8X5_003809 [Planctomycetota bacterium]|jgi:hypothetical protein
MNRALAPSLFCLLSLPLSAQDLGSLRTTRPLPLPGGQLEVSLQRGEAGSLRTLPFPGTEQRNWVFLRSPQSQSNFQEVPTLGAKEERGQLALPAGNYQSEGVVVGLDLKPSLVELPLADWERFQVQKLGAKEPAPFTSAFETPSTVRLRRIESSKLLVRLREGKEVPIPSAVLMTKTGQAVELRPLADPTTITPGGDFPVKFYSPSGTSAGVFVTALHEASGTRTSFTTRPGGIAHMKITKAGAWTLEAHELVPLMGARDADYELCSASLRFVSPAVENNLSPQQEGGEKR